LTAMFNHLSLGRRWLTVWLLSELIGMGADGLFRAL
jgi:hypothetical protein